MILYFNFPESFHFGTFRTAVAPCREWALAAGFLKGFKMTYCDAMNAYATNVDWIANGILFLLGMWKLWDLGESLTKWLAK